MSVVEAVTAETFPLRVSQAKRPVLVQFWATWCAPCRRVTPVVEELAAELAEVLDVVKVDVDAERILAQEYGIHGVPAFVVFVDGVPEDSWVGAAPKSELKRRLAAHLP